MQEPNKLDCPQVAELLGAFRDMELELSEVELVEDHLADCPVCRQELAAIEMVVASLQSLPELPSRDFADAIETRINERLGSEGQQKQPTLAVAGANVRSLASHSRRPQLRAMVAVAALMLFGFVAAITLAPKPPTEIAQAPSVSVSHGQFPDKRLDPDRGSPIPDEIVAAYDEEGSNSVTDVGISTNEDGLYAIKM